MAELSIHDYVNFSFRLRKRLPYYNGDEHELDLAVESITELLDELKILRDWTCMANELRRGEHKAHRVKRLDEYLQAMFGGKHAKLTEEQKKRFYNLQEAGLITNILTATAIDTRAVKNLSPASIKYICDQGQKFIDRRALAPHLCYFSFYDSLSTMRQAPILSMSCWERELEDFEKSCALNALSQKRGKKRKKPPTTTTTEPQPIEETANVTMAERRLETDKPRWLLFPNHANIYNINIDSVKDSFSKHLSLIDPFTSLTEPIHGEDCYLMISMRGELGQYLRRLPGSQITFKCSERHGS